MARLLLSILLVTIITECNSTTIISSSCSEINITDSGSGASDSYFYDVTLSTTCFSLQPAITTSFSSSTFTNSIVVPTLTILQAGSSSVIDSITVSTPPIAITTTGAFLSNRTISDTTSVITSPTPLATTVTDQPTTTKAIDDTTSVTTDTASSTPKSDRKSPSPEDLAAAIAVTAVVLVILIVILCGLICCYHMFKWAKSLCEGDI